MKTLVKFKCCNTEHLFTKRGEFKMCECGECGFDAGDEFYCRTLGEISNIEIINQENENVID